MITTLRRPPALGFLAVLGLLSISLYLFRDQLSRPLRHSIASETLDPSSPSESPSISLAEEIESLGLHNVSSLAAHYLLKPRPSSEMSSLIVDNFPRAANSSAQLPSVPDWNNPPVPHVAESTPLYIGFTRNWRLLQQAVVSYITAGWPPEDIYVVENTGTMNSNRQGRLSLQNPFYLDYQRLVKILGVNVITTPTLLTFAQLQNFYLSTSLNSGHQHYFWSHMDVAALSDELYEPYESLYMRSVRALRETLKDDFAPDQETGRPGAWAIRFFAYDRLALVNVAAFEAVGGWDTLIPFYGTDCDMHSRLHMAGWKQSDASAGLVYDLGSTLDDLEVLYRRQPPTFDSATRRSMSNFSAEYPPLDHRGSQEYVRLRDQFNSMQIQKNDNSLGRNTWQERQNGGQGEPYYRDPQGFDKAIKLTIEFGRSVFSEKWGHRDCNLEAVGLEADYAWRLEHDWDRPEYLAAIEKLQNKAEI